MSDPIAVDIAEIAEIKSRKYECFIEDHELKPWTPGRWLATRVEACT